MEQQMVCYWADKWGTCLDEMKGKLTDTQKAVKMA